MCIINTISKIAIINITIIDNIVTPLNKKAIYTVYADDT